MDFLGPFCVSFFGRFVLEEEVESHKKGLFLLRTPLPVGFGKLFFSYSDKVLNLN